MFMFLKQMRFDRIDQFRELHGKLSMPLRSSGARTIQYSGPRGRRDGAAIPRVVNFETLPGANCSCKRKYRTPSSDG
jgi:hypothetical protein